MWNTERKEKENKYPANGSLKKSGADKFLLYFVCLLACQQFTILPCFLMQSDQKKVALAHTPSFVQNEWGNRSNEHKAGTFALCLLSLVLPPKPPLCEQHPLSCGKKKWSMMELPKSHPLLFQVFLEISFLYKVIDARMIILSCVHLGMCLP